MTTCYYNSFTTEQKNFFLRSDIRLYEGLEPSHCVCFPLSYCDKVSKCYPQYPLCKNKEYAYFRFSSLEEKKKFLGSVSSSELLEVFWTSQRCRTMVAIDKTAQRELSRVFIDTLEGDLLKEKLDEFATQVNLQKPQEKISCGKRYLFYTNINKYFEQNVLLFFENFEIDGWSSDQLFSISPSIRTFKSDSSPVRIVTEILDDKKLYPVENEQVFLLSVADIRAKDLIAMLRKKNIRYEFIEINEGKAVIVNKDDYKITEDDIGYVIHRFNSDFPDIPINAPHSITHGFDFLSTKELRECSSVILYNRSQNAFQIMSSILSEIKNSKYDKKSHYFFFSNVSPDDKLTNDLKKYLEDEGIEHETIQLTEKQIRRIVVNDGEFVIVKHGIPRSRIVIADNAKQYMVCSGDGVGNIRIIENYSKLQTIVNDFFKGFNFGQLMRSAEFFGLTFVDKRDGVTEVMDGVSFE